MANQLEAESHSISYEAFSNLVRSEGLKVRKDIDSIYRYLDDDGKERFFYHETRRVQTGERGAITCATGHIGDSREFPTSEEFEWTPANLAEISKHFTRRTNFYIVLDGRNRSKITKEQFMSWERADIERGFKQIKIDVQELANQIVDATNSRKK